MNLESLKEVSLKCEELRYKSAKGEQFYCVLVLSAFEFNKEKLLKELPKDDTIQSKRFGRLPFHFMDFSNVTRVSIKRMKSYRAIRKKLTEPHPDLVNTAQLRLKKALAGELTGVSIELLKLKVEEIKKDTIQRRALQAAEKLPKQERDIFLAQLKSSKECLITNYMSAEMNLWITIQSETGSKQKRAKNGVTLILSREDHVKRGSAVPRLVEEGSAKGWIASDIVLIK